MSDAARSRLTRAQHAMLSIAQMQGWVAPTAAAELRTRDSLVRRGFLMPHPDYEEGNVYAPILNEHGKYTA